MVFPEEEAKLLRLDASSFCEPPTRLTEAVPVAREIILLLVGVGVGRERQQEQKKNMNKKKKNPYCLDRN